MVTKKKSRKELQLLRDEALESYLNREDCHYDVTGDALCRQYRIVIRIWAKTVQDTVGQATALTGGCGSCYAQRWCKQRSTTQI